MKKLTVSNTLILLLFIMPTQYLLAQKVYIYHAGWIDFNKNDRMDIFENPNELTERRVADLLSEINLNEKTCQLANLYGYTRVLKDSLPMPSWKNEIWKDGIANK